MNTAKHPLTQVSKEVIFSRLLEKELGYYKAILELTKEEGEVLQKSNPPKHLVQLGKKKQILFSCIEEVEQALAPIKKHWQGKVDKAGHLAEQVKAKLKALDQIVQQILELDKKNQALMQEFLKRLRSKKLAAAPKSS